ncbi:hypothetical protein DS2_10297 [Catenovulum agarivorans DS-2]|uniref:Sulfate transporter n=1 Tax=Catenovulum agarivorans DS-2 TaxID=1328313 RepID=W7QPM2_9ALTE|nr:DUF3164 family protein [Catenovulum agarivorans]EWH09833.1 hypothetical protein DS2_10297 [Catenovulum agarivorans DS-2]
MLDKKEIPDGYWQDAKGSLVPENMVKPIDKARNDLVLEVVSKALELQEALIKFRASTFADIDAFVELSAEQYDVKLGGKKGNVTLHSFDGQFKIVRAIQEHIAFDERLQAARELIDECLKEWTKDSVPELKAIIDRAFDVDKEGKINTARVLGLRRLDIKDKRWLTAMTAVSEALQVVGSKSYIRLYKRVGDSQQYVPISLDLAGA